VLRPEFNNLRRVAESDWQRTRKPQATQVFVELITPQTNIAPMCIVELNGQHGFMRIEWNLAIDANRASQLLIKHTVFGQDLIEAK
jgi:hypothetical protein